MKKQQQNSSSRRKFIRNISLGGIGLLFLSVFGRKKYPVDNAILGCSPNQPNKPNSTISSVKSGNWSDPATWGGRLPAKTDTPSISTNHIVRFDLPSVNVNGLLINDGALFKFDSTKTMTLLTTGNILVKGILEMQPASSSVKQTIRFTGIDETKFIGGGMNPLESDVGIWVIGNGQLNLSGTSKTPWANAVGDIKKGSLKLALQIAPSGWKKGDEISIAPTEPPTVGKRYLTAFDERVIDAVSNSTITINQPTDYSHPIVNNSWTAEVINLTRNVLIEGTPSGKSHIFIRSAKPQTIKYVGIRNMGPRKDRSNDAIKELTFGRYALHFHHSGDGSRDSLVEGNVIRDTGNHSYVPHVSNGITFKDNVAYNVTEVAFWWDPEEASHDIIWDHNLVAICKFVPRALVINEDAPTFASSCFLFGKGDDNIAINNIAIGNWGEDGAGFHWDANNEGVWKFKGNLAHNNMTGLKVWQNTTLNHIIEDFSAYHNGRAIFHGAYTNTYAYKGGSIYGNVIEIEAASANTNRLRFENINIDGGGMIPYLITIRSSPLNGEVPIFFRNLKLKGQKEAAIGYGVAKFKKNLDLIGCTIIGQDFYMHPDTEATETIRVQSISGQAFQVTKKGRSNIPLFAPVRWGHGTGLKGEYFNSTDFTKPAFNRIDSNISFSEVKKGLHYSLNANRHSIRWTGKVEPQFSEEYTFYIASAGGHRLWIENNLVVDNWREHPQGNFQSPPIPLIAGKKYNIRLEYFNNDNHSLIGLGWSSHSLPVEFIPQSQLYPPGVFDTTL